MNGGNVGLARISEIEPAGGQADLPELLVAAEDVLRQGLSLLSRLSDEEYSQIAREPFHASVGGHYRHVLEHFQCLIEGLPQGVVNYDARRRNPRIENEIGFASVSTQEIIDVLRGWTWGILQQPCKTVSSVGYQSNAPATIDSNAGRELAYCAAHAVHHFAIIRLLCNEVDIEVPKQFGYAPSTLKHQSSLAAD